MTSVVWYDDSSPWEARVSDPSSAATGAHDIRSAIRKALFEADRSDEIRPDTAHGQVIATFSTLGPADVVSYTLTENTGSGTEVFYYAEGPVCQGVEPAIPFRPAGRKIDFPGAGQDEWIIYEVKSMAPVEGLAEDPTTWTEGFVTLAGQADDGWATAIGRVYRLADLEPDWDSYNAPAIDRGAIRQAVYGLTRLSQLHGALPAPIVGPSPSGGVVLQWYRPHIEASIEIWAGSFEYFVAEAGTHRILEHGTRSADEFDAFLVHLSRLLVGRGE